MLVVAIFSACVGPLFAFSQRRIAYCNVLVLKNIENKMMNYELWIMLSPCQSWAAPDDQSIEDSSDTKLKNEASCILRLTGIGIDVGYTIL